MNKNYIGHRCEYAPFGEEWKTTMMRHKKVELVELYKRSCIDNMKSKTIYICTFCDSEYDSPEECKRCEKSCWGDHQVDALRDQRRDDELCDRLNGETGVD